MNDFLRHLTGSRPLPARPEPPVAHVPYYYEVRKLVADVASVGAENLAPNLVNAWGVAFNPLGFAWVAADGTGRSTLYDGDGHPQALVVSIPAPAGSTAPGEPAGIVFYGGGGFVVSNGSSSGPSRFIFAGEDGVISGWAPNVDFTNAIRVVDNSAKGTVYKGLAIGAGGSGALLYATDFRNARVDVFDATFQPAALPGRPFHDPHLPHGYAPFGIQAINGDIYVTYARQDRDKDEEVSGRGLGLVSVFSPTGACIRRLITRGALNAPWGLALAPASFGKFGNRLLVANFGEGAINAYDIANGRFAGRLRGTDREPLRIDGLRGLAFGNGVNNQPLNTLFFTAGPNGGEHGLYGRIDVAHNDLQADVPDAE
ncbi:TIGR03118 family protein [Massilia cavernae]|uniref:TIGR03118 family protein n=1 Tax=Massilia cavernae TaxID=2320864 RepID=A0A418Y5B7_9BURK|nr:TIGR03118 family protein [Massilia cavernae]RJG21607.1 TIGR03118 family protein [Massilia cavernae]